MKLHGLFGFIENLFDTLGVGKKIYRDERRREFRGILKAEVKPPAKDHAIFGHAKSKVIREISHRPHFIPLRRKIAEQPRFFPLKAYRRMLGSSEAEGPRKSPPCKVLSSRTDKTLNRNSGDLGTLSARFESGVKGISSIGYDPKGGTSYGIYQIASRTGSMDAFIQFLEDKAPAWASRLKAAGPADTGGRGGEMPRVWRQIAREDPKRFARLQFDFVKCYLHNPAMDSIEKSTGIAFSRRSRALEEVLWSTAVQHGPAGARRIFTEAFYSLKAAGHPVTDEELIEQVYKVREKWAKRIGGELKQALIDRYKKEKVIALSMLARDRVLT